MAFPIPFPIYQPAMRLIIAISQDINAVITTSPNHQYITGTIVRLYVYPVNGMIEANQFIGPITVLSDTMFSLPLNTTQFTPFVVPPMPTANNSQACVVPIGEVNETLKAAVQNVLPY